MIKQQDLFSQTEALMAADQQNNAVQRQITAASPLAERVRPLMLDSFVGQEHLVGSSGALRLALQRGEIPSFVLWGPPGSGKTTLARIVAAHTESYFVSLSAVTSGTKDIREVVDQAKFRRQQHPEKSTILFVDEIHRFNKSQQDTLLPHVEDGTLIFIGATTENPSFSMNSALLSRVVVYELRAHNLASLEAILTKALGDSLLAEDWLKSIAQLGDGDARRALGMLERLQQYFKSTKLDPMSTPVDSTILSTISGRATVRYDRNGEEHYNTISAFIKSMRDSDPDAAVYYLARMLEAGEDPLFITRRLIIFASEDVGNADPRGLATAIAAAQAVEKIGMPEGRICLAQAVTFLACAPKSNAAYLAVDEALEDVRKLGSLEIPRHIRNAPTKLMSEMGYGVGYKYAHDQEEGSAYMVNLPKELATKTYYRPKNSGLEIQIKDRLAALRLRRGASTNSGKNS